MNIKDAVIIVFMAFSLSFCKADASAFYLMKGEQAPFSGYLLDQGSELKARTAIQQIETYERIVEDQYAMINNLHQDLNLKETKINVLEHNQESWPNRILLFVGGMLIGSLVTSQINK